MSWAFYHRPPEEEQRDLPRLASKLLETGWPGLRDVVPAYRSLYVEYDPGQVSAAELRAWIAGYRAGKAGHWEDAPDLTTVEIPVCYDGEDLPEVATKSGLSEAEVIALHSGATYTVRALGFVAGFPFMETTPAPLQLPRRTAPRPRVPPHSLAVAGAQTGIYPVEAPGGWNLLGRTLQPAYDPNREPAFLVQPGQQVRFRAVTEATGPLPPIQPKALWPEQPQFPVLRVSKAGLLGLLMDRGRFLAGRYGLVRSGALDSAAAALANDLLGNHPGSPLLELHLTGPTFECLGSGVLAWAGAGLDAFHNATPLLPHSSFEVRAGDALTFRPNGQGRVTYLAVQGGFESLPFLGSASTDLKGSLGRPLRAGDVFGSAAPQPTFHLLRQFSPYRSDAPLRLIPVAEGEDIAPADAEALLSAPFRLRDLDRMAARLGGPLLRGGEITSEACPIGTLQVPPSGEVMVLLNDKGTLGGYRKPARLHPEDLPRLVQKLPGAEVWLQLG